MANYFINLKNPDYPKNANFFIKTNGHEKLQNKQMICFIISEK